MDQQQQNWRNQNREAIRRSIEQLRQQTRQLRQQIEQQTLEQQRREAQQRQYQMKGPASGSSKTVDRWTADEYSRFGK